MDFNSDQFRQPGPGQRAFRGFGDQAMRRYRVEPPAAQPASAPQQPAQPSGWTQPQLPDPPAAPARPARLTPAAQARADIAAAQAEARAARVATAQARARTAKQRQTLAEHRANQAEQRTRQATYTRPPVDPASVPDNTPQMPTTSPPPRPSQTVNINQVRNVGPSRISPAQTAAQNGPSRPSAPQRPAVPPAPAAGDSSRISTGMATAGRIAGVGAFVAAKALQSLSQHASDPKQSGKPLYKSSNGWMRS